MNLRNRWAIILVLVFVAVGAVFTARSIRAGQHVKLQLAGLAKKIGPDNAPVHMLVYSDFQCPACERAHGPITTLQRQFPEQVQLEFRHYPLERSHRWAMTAAVFAECAAQQGKFWPFHDRLYGEQAKWSNTEDAIPYLAQYTQEVGLDQRQVEQCLQDPRVINTIRADHDSGDAKQVQSTPTIFINDRRIVGGIDFVAKAQGMVLEELQMRGIKPPEHLEPLQMPPAPPVPQAAVSPASLPPQPEAPPAPSASPSP